MRALYTPTERAERLIAAGRLVLAIFSLVAIWSDPATPSRWQGTTYTLLTAYAVYALAAALVSMRRPLLSNRARVISHVFDLVLFSAFIVLTEGPVSPFFLYFVFSVFCATLRFDRRGLIATAVAALAIYIAIGAWGSLVVGAPEFDYDRFVIRCAYLTVLAALLFYLQNYQRTLQAELTALASWPRELPETLDEVIAEGLERGAKLLRAPRVALVWEDPDEPWIYVAEIEGDRLHMERLNAGACHPLVPLSIDSFAFVASAGDVRVPDHPDPVQRHANVVHPYLRERWRASTIVSAPVRGESTSGRLFAFDGSDASLDDVVLAKLVARLIASRMDQFRLVERVRETASSEERLRISRDLHDGVLQSLSALALRVRALQREIVHDRDAAMQTTRDLLSLLEDDQREIRAVVRGLRIATGGGSGDSELSARLESLRERLLVQWGLELNLGAVPDDDDVRSLRADIVHIVSEAASNAARHGDATRVNVQFAVSDRSLTCVIRDNGGGFGFSGRRDAGDLRNEGLGPRSLLERIESLGGSMAVESGSGGATLEIQLRLTREVA